MATRDPRSPREPVWANRSDHGREPTQSLHVDLDSDAVELVEDDREDSSALARGTHEARDSNTKIESPAAHRRTPPPTTPPEDRRSPKAVDAPRKSSQRRHPPVEHGDEPKDYLGTTLGAYRVEELLGKGGMGYVFRAEHVKLGREVALKLLRADYARRRDAVARFFQEARTVNRVRHRNIVDVTDWVELDDGTTFIIMELLTGVSLGRWARSGVDLPRALAVLVQICDGLGAAHAVGVIHRDLKPDNVIVITTSDGGELVKLLDFGVAKLLNRDDEDVGFQTAAGSVIGTPAYMSPEQAGGMAIDHRSDIYSLGAIMYELFCGQPMFRGRSFGEYVRKHLTELPVRPRATEGGHDIDERLEELILKCLEKEPSQRFDSILELRDGLLHLFGGVETQHSGLAHVGPRRQSTPAPLMYPAPGIPLPAPPEAYPQPTPAPLTLPPGALRLTTPPMPAAPEPTEPTVPPPTPAAATTMAPPAAPILAAPVRSPKPAAAMYAPFVPLLPAPEAGTPWYTWLLGGLVAVGLGVGGAWYITRDPAEPAARATVQATPIVAPAEPVPELVELRFDSLPSAGVFAEGHAAELCRTPCTFAVDLKDGAPTDKRVFVVRAAGYQDKQVVVAVGTAGADREFHITLDQLDPKPAAATQPGATGRPRPGTHKPTKPSQSAVPSPPPNAPKPSSSKIPDATDTLDPFRKP